MKRQRQYIFVTGVIFVAQVGLFSLFFLNQGDVGILTVEKARLDQKNKELTAKIEHLESQEHSHTEKRAVASIGSGHVDLSNFYFVQAEESLAKKDSQKALEFLSKIKDAAPDSETLAKAQYKQIKILCDQKLETECIQEIDTIVSQFPDTKWAGESLLLLSRIYYNLNKHHEARQILEIVKKDFKKHSELKLELEKPKKHL